MTVKRCAAAVCMLTDRKLVVVNYALEKDILEETDVLSYMKIFSSHLCKGNCSFAVFLSPGTFLADTLTKRLQLILKHAGNNALNDLQMHVVG